MAVLTHKNWILTRSGKQFDLFDPQPEMIDIRDIAHALSLVCRFGGHVRHFYSVAQHSVLVSRQVPTELALLGLMHDATEAYLGDVVRPLKRGLPAYQEIEDRLWRVIQARFSLGDLTPEVKDADLRALMTERRDLFDQSLFTWAEDEARIKPYFSTIHPQEPEEARRDFLARFRALTNHIEE